MFTSDVATLPHPLHTRTTHARALVPTRRPLLAISNARLESNGGPPWVSPARPAAARRRLPPGLLGKWGAAWPGGGWLAGRALGNGGQLETEI